ncbi:hypothetical protein J3L16_03875 [Alteromonas sp. 5E99-2]|uniref:hypothetical protein n=1 Tax=Alteromonas sp. 5E99-2 TaxID=2817683 RepID=UPI001A99E269|nr:hypothetical protein [Alteromonas sp. 5E99-2]MBO1254826.1 hypothetical protein [Alteromonas sp. 5E99-2]
MDSSMMEVYVGVVAATIAIIALFLQRYEIIKNGRMSALIHASNLIQQRIDYYENIIQGVEERGESSFGLKSRINDELRPLKHKIDFELLDLMGRHDGVTQIPDIKSALKSKNTQ